MTAILKEADGIVVVYDIHKEVSWQIPKFLLTEKYFSIAKEHIPEKTPLLLLGNKCDLQRHIYVDEGKRYANKNKMDFC